MARLIQIGENAKLLSEDFKLTHYNIPWGRIIKIRNIAAHHYEILNVQTIWNTINEDIPKLK
jgi:uncharacterized protein with HEPN domain